MLFGLGGDTGVWAVVMSGATTPAWQVLQVPSVVTSMPAGFAVVEACNLRPFGTGFTKTLSSWQAPQARLLGAFFQLSASGAGFAGAGLRWHFTQLRTSCG